MMPRRGAIRTPDQRIRVFVSSTLQGVTGPHAEELAAGRAEERDLALADAVALALRTDG